ncbi:MAG: flagellar hook-basal body complex protein [Planctomycetota bacterium]|nr:flagellar hook-basal body complex protein [Planctomycetota bacterium]
MALIRSLNTAVSGLRAQQFRIEVIGNNIANIDTTAFKGSRVDFSTLLSQNLSFGVAPQGFLGGIDPTQIGHGTRVASTTTDFSQGPTEATGVASDLAIQGNGFLIMRDEFGGMVYTRDGSFTINPSNLLHDPATGYVVQGWMADENFQVNPGGSLTNIEIAVGVKTIARPTTVGVFGGNLNSSGDVASQGTLLFSDRLYDSRITNTDLISAENPLGLARATADTPLANLVRSLGDFVPFTDIARGASATSVLVFPELGTQLTGVGIQLSALKGDRELPDATFTVGDPPPSGGSSLGDFIDWLGRNFGINSGVWDGVEQTEHTYSYSRMGATTGEEVNGTLSLGVGGSPDDTATLSSLIDHQADFRGVRIGDYIRFTSGAAAGQISEVTGISASTSGGALDSLTFRTDGFNSLSVVPAIGDTYVVQAPAGVRVASDVNMLNIDGSGATVTVGAPSTNGQVRTFTITDSAVNDFALEQGIHQNQRVDFMSGGALVSGWISSVSGNVITVAFDSAQSQDPDAGTMFSVVDQADGSIEIAGNVGMVNHLSNLEITSAGSRIPLFDNPPVVEAIGESVKMTVTVYDSLGTPRLVELSFVYQSSSANGPNVWRYFAESIEDADMDRVVGSGEVLFGSNGQFLTTGKATEMVTINLEPTVAQSGGVVSPLTFEIDLSRLTQFATTSSEVQLRDQDGFESGTLRQYAVGSDGLITGVFSNGLTRSLGQVALARFANPNGLDADAGNLFRAAPNSGVAQVGMPGTFGRGTIVSGFLEESNVDLAQQFTDLIIGQRAFQANARTITVSDELLQELVNLI